ncbi:MULTISPECIES: DUF4003 family protein [Clostridium]|uniref:DUF4003 family protein n=1 Tax=Clostridium TaxID=1485 RepID=UPI001D9FBEEB|nr:MULTISPECIES: DUF4003 family protein [Clostridium]MBS5306346.1 DUF4003 family protein [Clostridium sp.]MDB1943886.1 DUF4003 family protein [Clostridium tertium]MDB1950948.1 DUF4003 family protein [Clostridium tertium]MDU1278208.1 DUF4003 family protein [Clostridium sp.]MDU3523939.1 DUF4003 family protein [Clostridium sp.]
MIENKIELLIKNSNSLENVKSTFGMDTFKRCNALNLTLRNINANVEKINHCIDIIKNNSSIFSNFRGNNLLTTAVNLSMQPNPEESFNDIMIIYGKLKNYFLNNQFLVLAAQIIYNYKNTNDIDLIVINTRKAYDTMKKNHLFLTGQDDICAAALIATTSNNLDQTFIDMEECYNILRSNSFYSGNNLQALSHILSLFEGLSQEKCNKVILLDKVLRNHSVPLKGYSLPILGVAALTNADYEKFATDLNSINNSLKKQSGFGSFTLGRAVRNMIIASLLSLESIEDTNSLIKEKLIETTNNISLNIVIIMQIAAATAATSAAAAAAASSN